MHRRLLLPGICLVILAICGCAYHRLFDEAESLAAAGKYEEALKVYEQAASQKLIRKGDNLPGRIADVKSRWASSIAAEAEDLAGGEHKGRALLLMARAAELDATYAPRARVLSNSIGKGQAYRVELAPRNDESRVVSEALRKLISDDRGIELLPDAQPLETTPTAALVEQGGMPDLAGDLRIEYFLGPLLSNVTVSPLLKKANYVAGQTVADNPQYEVQKLRLANARAQLAGAQKRAEIERDGFLQSHILNDPKDNRDIAALSRIRLDDADRVVEDHRREVERELENLKKLDPKVKQPLTRLHQFEAKQHTQWAGATLGGWVLAEGEAPRKIDEKLQNSWLSEEYPAQPIASLPPSYPVIRSEEEMRYELAGIAAASLRTMIHEHLARAREAKLRRAMNEAEPAVQIDALCQWLAAYGRDAKPEALTEINRKLAGLTGVDNASNLIEAAGKQDAK